MTCLDSTIHSWQAFNSLVCPLMLRTNNRYVESLNISLMSPNVENIHKFTQYTDYLSVTKKKLSWLNNLFMVMFHLISMSSYAKNKLQMCWVTEHQCGSRQMWKIFTNSPSIHTICLLLKMSSFAWTIYSWLAFYSLGCSLMLRISNRCVESFNISVEVAKCGKVSHINPVHSLFVYNKNDYFCLKNLFMVRFQLIRMSSYAKIKLQMCWVTQRKCRSRQMWKIFTNSPSRLTLYLLQKMTILDWTIHSWQVSTH